MSYIVTPAADIENVKDLIGASLVGVDGMEFTEPRSIEYAAETRMNGIRSLRMTVWTLRGMIDITVSYDNETLLTIDPA